MRKILFIICAVLLPVLAVGLYRGLDGHFWISLILLGLTLLVPLMWFFLPIHALYVVLVTRETGALR